MSLSLGCLSRSCLFHYVYPRDFHYVCPREDVVSSTEAPCTCDPLAVIRIVENDLRKYKYLYHALVADGG